MDIPPPPARRRLILIPVAASVLVNAAILVGFAGHRPAYLRDSRLNDSPDAQHYLLLGHNYLEKGHYSRCGGPPYITDMVRPPVYPLFAAGLDIVGGAAAIYLVQALL